MTRPAALPRVSPSRLSGWRHDTGAGPKHLPGGTSGRHARAAGLDAVVAISSDLAMHKVAASDRGLLVRAECITRALPDLVIQPLRGRTCAPGRPTKAVVVPHVAVRIDRAVTELDTTIRHIRSTIFELHHRDSATLRNEVAALVRGLDADPRLHNRRADERAGRHAISNPSGNPRLDHHPNRPAKAGLTHDQMPRATGRRAHGASELHVPAHRPAGCSCHHVGDHVEYRNGNSPPAPPARRSPRARRSTNGQRAPAPR